MIPYHARTLEVAHGTEACRHGFLRHTGYGSQARCVALAFFLGALCVTGATPQAAASELSIQAEIIELAKASIDPEGAAKAAKRLRQIISKGLDPKYERAARQLLLRALVAGDAPASEIVAAATDASPTEDAQPRQRVAFNAELSEILLSRGEELDQALEFAKKALAAIPNDAYYEQLRAAVRGIVGRVQVRRGDYGSALIELTAALPSSPDSQVILFHMGAALERTNRPEDAINAYIRSVSVFAAYDTSAAKPLRDLYLSRKGHLDGLDRRIEVARHASMKRVALDSRREEKPAPHWKLVDFEGRTLQLADYRGKILVVDFWGSWCGPCRAELPYFQSMYERYKGRGVEFIGINWERLPSAEQRLRAAREFMESNNLSFPVVMDHEATAVQAYNVDAFPTVILIDKTGRIRYRNPGFSPAVEDIVVAQIESLRNE